MSRELAYIRNGRINSNAANFVLPVAHNLDAIHIAWWRHPTLGNRGASREIGISTEEEVSYRILIESESMSSNGNPMQEDAMYQPHLNVSHSGQLPTKQETVRVSLPCTGRVHATVHIDITFQFEITKKNGDPAKKLNLKLKRQKVCTTAHGLPRGDLIDQNENWEPDGKPDMAFIALIISAFVIMILTIIFILLVNWKGNELIFGVLLNNDKTVATTATTISSNAHKNNVNVAAAYQKGDDQMLTPTIRSNNDANPYEAVMSQHNLRLGQDIPNVVTYNDAGLLTMDPRSMCGPDQPPPPLLPPPPLPPNPGRNMAGGIQRTFSGNKFEFVTDDFNSEAESRVTDWVNQQQNSQVLDQDMNLGDELDNINSRNANISIMGNYAAEIENGPELENLNNTAEMVFDGLEVDRHRLKLGCLVQEGTFGRVYQVNIDI